MNGSLCGHPSKGEISQHNVSSRSFSVLVNMRPEGGPDLAAMQGQTRISLRAAIVHPCSGCPHCKHDPGLLTRPTQGVLDASPSCMYTSSKICKWHHILYELCGGGSQKPFHVVGYIYKLFGT